MDLFYVVDYLSEERGDLFSFLRESGFSWINQKELEDEEHCFPIAVDVLDKCVGMTSTYFLKAFSNSGGQRVSASDFKKVLNNFSV